MKRNTSFRHLVVPITMLPLTACGGGGTGVGGGSSLGLAIDPHGNTLNGTDIVTDQLITLYRTTGPTSATLSGPAYLRWSQRRPLMQSR